MLQQKLHGLRTVRVTLQNGYLLCLHVMYSQQRIKIGLLNLLSTCTFVGAVSHLKRQTWIFQPRTDVRKYNFRLQKTAFERTKKAYYYELSKYVLLQ